MLTRLHHTVYITVVCTIALHSYGLKVYGAGPEPIEALRLEQSASEDVNAHLVATDTVPLTPRDGDFLTDPRSNPYDLKDPSVIDQKVTYDPETGRYILSERIGDQHYRPETYMTFEEYMEWQSRTQEDAYFDNLSGVHNEFITFSDVDDPVEQFNISDDLLNRLFGGTEIKVEPKGNIDLTIGGNYQARLDPNIPVRQQRQFNPNFDMDIDMGLNAKIGEKLNLNFDYNSNATFNFENKFQLKFDSDAFSEDDIIKSIEAGDVSLPLKSSLIQGNQSLFGLKTELQFGKLYLTTVVSQQRSEQKNIRVQNGAQWQEYSIKSDLYDEDRHFLMSHYNRGTFEQSLSNLPQIQSLFRITRAEVWVTSVNNEFQDLRQIVALTDLGEAEVFTSDTVRQAFERMAIPDSLRDKKNGGFLPDNSANLIYETLISKSDSAREINQIKNTLEGPTFNMVNQRDFEIRRARKLSPSRYTIIPELGVISMDAQVQPDEVLAVAYEFTFNGQNYQVGEFSSDAPSFSGDSSRPSNQVLFVKMLKSSVQRTDVPLFDLMMKNVYAIGAYNASEEDFQFDIYYDDPGQGVKRYLPEEAPYNTPLLSAFGLDQLNFYGDPAPDGFFDFIPGVTINTRTGKVMFPVLEPFGDGLRRIAPPDSILPEEIYERYQYDTLYDISRFRAQEFQERNRFVLKGSFKSSVSSEIRLGAFNLPPNSVTVRSGGVTLREGVDYTVDYNIGVVRIVNDAYLSSGAPIDVSFEDRTLFGFNRQSMLGLRADYKLNKKMNVGGTFMKLWERPFTPKVNYGNDPINNNIYGLDFSYSDRAPWLTKAVDALPVISTSEESSVDLYVEGALLRPGHPKAINVGDDEGGVVFIDDFEGSRTATLLNTRIDRWKLASVPQQNPRFPMGNDPLFAQSVQSGANRARLNWYQIQRNIPINQSDLYEKLFSPQDIFPGVQFQSNLADFRTFDIRYYPSIPGQYNFDPPEGTANSAGLIGCNETGGDIELAEPETRWAGIMRDIDATNFEATNVQAIEFWVLNPFEGDMIGDNGELVFHIGNVSEDILRDDRVFYENALPIQGDAITMDTTIYSRVSPVPPVIFAFSNDEADRQLQDLGLDGFDDAGEFQQFADYVNELQLAFPLGCVNSSLTNETTAAGEFDVSRDNYLWFDDDSWPAQANIAQRFSLFNGLQGNSPIVTGGEQFAPSFTRNPDAEDINYDGTSETAESYFEYRIPLVSANQRIDTNIVEEYITDIVDNSAVTPGEVWYRFKVPLNDLNRGTFGAIQDFRAIKYVRMMVQGFEEPKTFRFARLEFTRNQWRIVEQSLDSVEDRECAFDINTVNFEENGNRMPFNYVLPPGIDREANFQSAFRGQFLNEQSLSMELCGCQAGELKGVFKQVGMNMREFKKIKMFAHAEANNENIEDGHFSLVLRLGSDYTNNYYERVIPLDMSEPVDDSPSDPEAVWKPANNIDLLLQDLVDLKVERGSAPINVPFTQPYMDGGTISVLGSPNLADVFTVFLGIQVNENTPVGESYCADFWVNELRLAGLSDMGGAAAVGRLDMQLADFGNVALSGSISSVGWGALDQQLLERNQEKITTYDAATNLELGQFFGKDSRIRVPFFAQISNETKTPRYDPYDRDLTAEEKLDMSDNRDSLRRQIQTRSTIKTVSVNNVRVDPKPDKKAQLPWDVSNLSVTYTNTKTERSDPILSKDDSKQETGVINYQYSTGSKPIEPFKKLIKTDKWIKFIKDFNFNPLPTTIGVRSVMDRRQRERQFRLIGEGDPLATATSRQFLWNRDYRLSWDLTKSLRFNYNATNVAAIDELDNDNRDFFGRQFDDRRQYLWDNVKDFGRNKQFDQNVDASYRVPFDKFGILDWVSTDVQYSANYNWTRAAINNDSLGNSVSNGSNGSVRVNLNFEKLYDKSDYLKKINRGKGRSGRDTRSRRATATDKDKKEAKEPGGLAKGLLRPLMMVRRLRFNYSEQHSSYVPGLLLTPELLGMSSGFSEPGWGYVLGSSPDNDWLRTRAARGEFSDHECVNQEFNRTYSERWDAQLALEPIRDFKVDVSMNRTFSNEESSLFKFQEDIDDFDFGVFSEFGTYTISYMAPNTLFKDGDDNIQALFETFKDNLQVVSERLNAQDPNRAGQDHEEYDGFKFGYGLGQQEVIIPAFLAAYTNRDPNDVDLDLFDQFPRPNLTLTYNGLTKIPWFKERFSSISIAHGYNGTLSTSSFRTDLRHSQRDRFGDDNINQITGDYYARLNIPQVVISESLSPLVRFSMETISGVSLNFEVQKNRTLSLDTDNQQLNETRATNWQAGFGYVLNDVYLGFIPGSKKKDTSRKKKKNGPQSNNTGQSGQEIGGELRITCDFSLRDDVTIQHLWGIDVTNRPTRGQRVLEISPSIDYVANKYLTMRLFCDYRSTRPATDQTFPITNVAGGLRMSFTLR